MAVGAKSDHKFTSYIIMDFETGGKDPSEVALSEIGMIGLRGDTLEEIGRYSSLIKPYPQIMSPKTKKPFIYEDEAIRITGLTQELLEIEGKDIAKVNEEVLMFLALCNINKSRTGYKPVIVAHNALYEVRCIQQLMTIMGAEKQYAAALHGDTDFFGNFQPHYLDTIDMGKELWAHNQRMTSFNLDSVLERAAIERPDGHRAMNDVIPTTQFFSDTVKSMRSTQGASTDSVGNKSYRDNYKFKF